MRIKLIFISMLLASCGGVSKLPSFTSHKIDIRQGNLVTPEMRSKLELGMARTQVRAVLGSPLVNDALHADRWDYLYRLEIGGKLTEQQRMTVFFDGDVVTRIDDGTMPSQPVAAANAPLAEAEAEAVPAPDGAAPASAPEPVAEVSSMFEGEVTAAVQGWVAAWSAQDVDKYLASYAAQFKPASGVSRATWATQRGTRISQAKNIKVELSDIKVSMQGKEQARVSFKQSYLADSHKALTLKILELKKVGDTWLIVSEQAAEK